MDGYQLNTTTYSPSFFQFIPEIAFFNVISPYNCTRKTLFTELNTFFFLSPSVSPTAFNRLFEILKPTS
jgi:hypothetical protein